MMNSRPFARSIALMAAISAAMQGGMSLMAAAVSTGADQYRSRGKGRSNGSSRSLRTGNRSGKTYPFSSAKQNRKTATRQVTVSHNGFTFMNTRRSADRLSMSQVG